MKNLKKIRLLCVISARGGSEGLKNKNIKNFYGKPLISWSISQALKSQFVKEVFVSTDSKKIAQISIKHGAKIPFLRKKNISKKNSSKFLVWKDALDRIEKLNNCKYDYYLDLDCTNPLRSTKDINEICKNFFKKKNFLDGMFTVVEARKNPYFNIVEKTKKNYYKISKTLRRWPTSRQSSPKVYDQVASMYIFNSNFIRKRQSMYQGRLGGYLMKKFQNFDIDSNLDFFLIKQLFKKYYLKKLD
jgi:CMP-N,N'-diacetyllegionaminic acid synthase